MITELSPKIKQIIKYASSLIKSVDKRAFMANVARQFCNNSPRLAESHFGWNRHAVQLRQHKLRTRIICYDNYLASGRKKAEVSQPQVEKDIHSLVEPHSQVDPKMKNTFAYTRLTAVDLRQQLIDEKNWQNEELPCERSFNNILNRMGYLLHRVQKSKPPKKKSAQTQFFDNLHKVNQEADQCDKTLRISIDCKATVNLGNFSGNGVTRGQTAVQALDHDMAIKNKMIPFGILNMHTDQLYILFGHSHKTSDFICDGIEKWWGDVRDTYPDINELVINLDNGPESSGQRTQFMARMQAFSSMTGLRVSSCVLSSLLQQIQSN